ARGFPPREYLHLQASEPRWLDALPADRVRHARPEELPAGCAHGGGLRVPLVEMPAHLKGRAPTRTVGRAVTSLRERPGRVHHGGAGLTLSWGCARRVVELAAC